MSQDNSKYEVKYIPKWQEKRLPFIFTVSFEFGSTMFDWDFQCSKSSLIFEVGFLWLHLDIYFNTK